MKCLCCEDEEEVLEIYKTALEERGHEIITSIDSEECLKIYLQSLEETQESQSETNGHPNPPFDAVILDYKMPKKNGLEIAEEIFQQCPNQRIIFASANVNETVESSLRELNQVVEVLKKPFDISQLIETLESEEIQNGLKLLLENIGEKMGNPEKNNAYSEFSDEQIKKILSGVNKIYNIKEH